MDVAAEKSDATKAMLSQLWERNLPLLLQRLDTLDAAASASLTGDLSTELRQQAFFNAHNLSGSLGMFGYSRGTEIAREIERLLEASVIADPKRLNELTTALRGNIFPEASSGG